MVGPVGRIKLVLLGQGGGHVRALASTTRRCLDGGRSDTSAATVLVDLRLKGFKMCLELVQGSFRGRQVAWGGAASILTVLAGGAQAFREVWARHDILATRAVWVV